jgi:hypothetical protein
MNGGEPSTTEVAGKSRKRASNPNRGAKPGERRGGRQKGTPNLMTRQVKEMILGALDRVGGETYLARQAEENPGPFLTLVGKVLPLQLTGKDGGPILHSVDSDAVRQAAAEMRALARGEKTYTIVEEPRQ